MKIQNFKQFNEAIYAAAWKENYEKKKCSLFDLRVNDEFEMETGAKAKYLEDDVPTIKVFYSGKNDENIYFTYEQYGSVVYKISKSDLLQKIVKNKNYNDR